MEQVFDIPVVRQENIKIPCNVSQQKLSLSKSSMYNIESYCCRFYKDKWDHVIAGGKLIDCETLLLQPVIATVFWKITQKKGLEKNFGSGLLTMDEQSHLVCASIFID